MSYLHGRLQLLGETWSSVDGRSSPVESLLVRRSEVVSITLSRFQSTYPSLFGREGDLRLLAQTLDIGVLRFHYVIVGWHDVARGGSETGRRAEFVLWFFISPWWVHAKRHARLPHSICFCTHVQLLNRTVVGEGRLVEGACELVDPQILFCVLSSWNTLGDSKVLFFNFVLILYQVSLGVTCDLFEEWSALVPLLLVARAVIIGV